MRGLFLFAILVFFNFSQAIANTDSLVNEVLPPVSLLQEDGLYLEGPMYSGGVDSALYYVQKSREVIGKIKEMGNFVRHLDEKTMMTLPVGISQNIGGIEYTIGIASMKLKPGYAELEAFMEFKMPQNGKTLSFMGRGIKFTRKGGISEGRLELIGDYAINLNGEKSQIILKGNATKSNTYVAMDCDGFKDMGIEALLRFSRDLLLPENGEGKVIDGNVDAHFQTVITNWNDLIVSLNIPPFQLKSAKGVGVTVKEAIFDFSDYQNSNNIVFPEGYQANGIPENPNTWRGVYIKELSVRLPRQFKSKSHSGRTELSAKNMVIDEQGVSGLFKGTNLINTDDGDMNGWAYSLDSLGIHLVGNDLVSAGFKGEMKVPIASDQTPFAYSATITADNEYFFAVDPQENIEFPVFNASEVTIYEASTIRVSLIGDTFYPEATLHGKMNINAAGKDGEDAMNLADIDFENLTVRSVEPYLEVGLISYGANADRQRLGNFPISLEGAQFKTLENNQVGLDFDMLVHLTGKNGGAFNGEGGVTVVGGMHTENGRQKWRFVQTKVRKISIDVDQTAFKFKGSLTHYEEDIDYGSGFNGQIQAEFKPGIKVAATAIFGNVEGHRYWYADAMATFPTPIPMIPPIGISGFGGGGYYGMKLAASGVGSELGQTASGAVYIPDVNAGLGLKASLYFANTTSEKSFNGDVLFEMNFFKSGGIRNISLGGNGYFMSDPVAINTSKLKSKVTKLTEKAEKLGNLSLFGTGLDASGNNDLNDIIGSLEEGTAESGASLSANVMINYDFENSTLHGNFKIYANVAGGLIKGIGPNNLAGWAVMHFAPSEWYFYAGTPDNRVGLKAGIGPISAQVDSYFMMGTKIPGSPPPPPEVSDILGGIDLDYMKDENALGLGQGIGFGASLSVDTGDLNFLMFYGRFAAGAGFDLMLKDYGSAECAGRNGPIGMNGWYANGQAYAYFEGSIGIRVKVFGKGKNIEILSIGAAAVLQAKLPNPFWMRGIVGGRYRVLGGLVSGSCRFEVVIGEECEIVGGSVVEGVKVIADLTPKEAEKDVDVFGTPQALFNMPIDKNFEMVDNDGKKKSFRIKLDEFNVYDGSNTITGNLKWNVENDVVAFEAFDVLPPKKQLQLKVAVSFEEFYGGVWKSVVVDGTIYKESKVLEFTTGEAPDFIPASNVQYSYPVVGMYNYYQKEHQDGYIKLKRGQPYLFESSEGWQKVGKLNSSKGNHHQIAIQYANSQRQVNFEMPSDLDQSSVYAFELVNQSTLENKNVDRNVKNEKKDAGSGDGTVEITTKKADKGIKNLDDKLIYEAQFRVSKYNTFGEKAEAIFKNSTTFRDLLVPWRVHQLSSTYNTSELFDEAEISGNRFSDNTPLLQFEATATGNRYLDEDVQPVIYNNYPIATNLTINNRNTDVLGLLPVKAMTIDQDVFVTTLSDGAVAGSVYLKYSLPFYMFYDWVELQSKIVSNYEIKAGMDPKMEKIVSTLFPVIRQGAYQFKVFYTLPGTNVKTSEYTFTKQNKVGDL